MRDALRAVLLPRDTGEVISVGILIALDVLGVATSVLATAVFAVFAERELRLRESVGWTPLNIALTSMGLAISLLFAATLFLHFNTDPIAADIISVFQTACVSTAELCYVFYSWARGWSMLELASRSLYKAIKRGVAIMPFVVLSPVVIGILRMHCQIDIIWLRGAITFSGASVALFDLIIITVFLASLRKNLDMECLKTDTKLRIICSHGLVASAMMLLSLCALTAVLSAPVPYNVSLALVWICDMFLLGCYSTLVLMKISLYRHHLKNPSTFQLPQPSNSKRRFKARTTSSIQSSKKSGLAPKQDEDNDLFRDQLSLPLRLSGFRAKKWAVGDIRPMGEFIPVAIEFPESVESPVITHILAHVFPAIPV
ncbi:hypothetical protein HDU83_004962 [Entophlyctis luteolus]|nr:hypothetical protein HDU83_004962 [Entophlyctis luteolus]